MAKTYIYKPIRFFFVTNLVMWASWMAAAYLSYQPNGGPGKLISALELLGLLSPVGTAIWIIATSGSRELKKDFYNKLFDLRSIKLSSVPAVFIIMPLVMVSSVIISHIFFGQTLSQLYVVKGSPFAAGIVPAQLLIFLAPLLEEMGWKGYGMDSLRGNRTFLKATLIYGALWAFWHIPLFFVNGYYHNMIFRANPLFALNFVVSVFAAAVIINWIWYMNKGNILTPVIFHAIVNIQGILRMTQTAKCVETVLILIIAVVIIRSNKKMFFGKFPAEIGYFGGE